MKLYVFATRDKKLGAFNVPMFKREDIEHVVEDYSRGLKLIDPSEISRAADQALYYLGQYDDSKGSFELLENPDKLLDFEDYVPRKSGE